MARRSRQTHGREILTAVTVSERVTADDERTDELRNYWWVLYDEDRGVATRRRRRLSNSSASTRPAKIPRRRGIRWFFAVNPGHRKLALGQHFLRSGQVTPARRYRLRKPMLYPLSYEGLRFSVAQRLFGRLVHQALPRSDHAVSPISRYFPARVATTVHWRTPWRTNRGPPYWRTSRAGRPAQRFAELPLRIRLRRHRSASVGARARILSDVRALGNEQRRAGVTQIVEAQSPAPVDRVRVLCRDRASAPARNQPDYARCSESQVPKRLTAFAITNARMTIDIIACATIIIFAQRANGITSVGLKAVALVNPRYK